MVLCATALWLAPRDSQTTISTTTLQHVETCLPIQSQNSHAPGRCHNRLHLRLATGFTLQNCTLDTLQTSALPIRWWYSLKNGPSWGQHCYLASHSLQQTPEMTILHRSRARETQGLDQHLRNLANSNSKKHLFSQPRRGNQSRKTTKAGDC